MQSYLPHAGRRMRIIRKVAMLGFSCALWFLPSSQTHAASPASYAQADFGNMSIEELMRVPLTLSRTEESFAQTAAAAYIVTGEDIRRSGATSIPEALRGVPGVEVAHVDQHTWAVSVRGFNDTFANKLLVMIDGRTVYTPLFSGVFWDVQDVVLEDVEHIEVIRGSGSTLWGANAVNGVINIVTKSAAQTQGGLITAGGGLGERAFGTVRYGGKIGPDAHYRVYVKYFDRDDTGLRPSRDDGEWNALRGGFRTDWTPGTGGDSNAFSPNQFTFQGDIYAGEVDQFSPRAVLQPSPRTVVVKEMEKMDGGNLLGRWTHRFSDEASFQFQTYYDRTHRDTVIFSEQRDTFDADFQNKFRPCAYNSVVWGLGYRITSDDTGPNRTVVLRPSSRNLNLFSGFLQDEISILEDTLKFIIGTKIEHNDFTGWEVQPSARLLWAPVTNHTFWASVNRAVRTPSRAENDAIITSGVAPDAAAVLFGSHQFESEKLMAYELGYRMQALTQVSFDTALFFNDYDDLRTLEFLNPSQVPAPFVAAQVARNRMHGETYGAELAANWQPLDWWRFRASYTFLQMDLHRDARSNNPADESIEGQSPHSTLR